MLTQADFRVLALSMPEVEEGSHFENADFRVRGKIFATLREADGRAVLKLQPGEQSLLMEVNPGLFEQLPGQWGMKGWTRMRLDMADAERARHAMTMAWRNAAPKKLLREVDTWDA
jgi:hypothetical protein